MKKFIITASLLLGLIAMESFRQSSSQDDKEIKYGVWKSYQDYINGHLTDLGHVIDRNKFEQEEVNPKNTKYWGAKIPLFSLQKNKFLPQKGSVTFVRFADGRALDFLISPNPIGIFSKGNIKLQYDENKDVAGCNMEGDITLYASKENGEVVSIHDTKKIRSFFDDDPEIQNAFDTENATVHTNTGSKHFLYFAKYAVRYNRKHGPPAKNK